MLLKAAARIHSGMIKNGVQAPSIDVIVYALKIVTNTVSITLLTLLAGMLTREMLDTVILLAAFAVIRVLTGGYHLKSGLVCIVVSTVVLSVLPNISLNDMWTHSLTGIAMAIVLLLAPTNYDKHARIDKRHYPYLKAIAAVLVGINFAIGSDMMALAFFTQALTLPFKEGGEEE